eukprot:4998410-Prorocentrum_lima.AAC.1
MPQQDYTHSSQPHKFKREQDESPDVDCRPLPPQPQPPLVKPYEIDFDDDVLPPCHGCSRSRDGHPKYERSRSRDDLVKGEESESL